jgi:hypothetical protein
VGSCKRIRRILRYRYRYRCDACNYQKRKTGEEALLLAKEGIYDRTAVLETLDDPNKYEVIKRMGEIPILSQEVQEQTKNANFWEGQFDNLAQNYNRLSIEMDKLKMVIKEFQNNGKPAKQKA